jgi:hypothetical protein
VLLRQQFMERPLELVFDGVPAAFSTEYMDVYGITMNLWGTVIPPWAMLAFVGIFGSVFFVLALLRLNRKIGSR